MPQTRKAIVIGAGIAGIAASIRLAVQGYQVVVYDKNDYAGGKIARFQNQGFQFDEGPSLFTQPGNVEELFKLAGEPIEDYFSYQPLPIACKYFYENGKVVNAFTNLDAFANELHQKLGEDPLKVYDYLNQSKKIYDKIGSVFLNYSLHTRQILKAPLLAAVAAAKPKLLFKTLNALNEEHFTKPETIQLFNRFATYNGSNPYKAPGMLSLIPHLEQNEGTYYPKGGMISIANALHQLALKKGVKFKLSTPVNQIIHEHGTVNGVVVNNTKHLAHVVISNMDVYFTYKKLLQNEGKSKSILKQERSSSAIIFYWGINRVFNELELHNIFFSNNYKAEFDHLFNSKTLYHDPTVYINITSKMEASHAPEGKENWFVMVNAPANVGQDWKAFRETCRASIINKLSRLLKVDIAALIETEQVMDPVIIEEKTMSYMGSLYGTSSNSKMAAFLRHPNYASAIKGLYFVGGSVHPGGGIPLCLLSAKLVGQMVKQNHN